MSLLHPESDFTVFMAPGVPPDVRRAALRRLWQLCPDLARPDGLVEYGEDYTDAAKAAGIVRTSYRVAKGAVRGDDEAAPTTAADEAPREFEDAEHADRSDATDGPASASADDERKDEH